MDRKQQNETRQARFKYESKTRMHVFVLHTPPAFRTSIQQASAPPPLRTPYTPFHDIWKIQTRDRLAGDRPALVSWIVIPSCHSWVLGVDHRRTIGPIIWLSGFHALCLTGLKLAFPLDRGPANRIGLTDFESRRRSWLQGEDHPNSFSCWNRWIIHFKNWEQRK